MQKQAELEQRKTELELASTTTTAVNDANVMNGPTSNAPAGPHSDPDSDSGAVETVAVTPTPTAAPIREEENDTSLHASSLPPAVPTPS